MSCFGCKCNFCARNVELEPKYFTPGEVKAVEDLCYDCDDCYLYGGDHSKRAKWRPDCPGYMEAQKYTDAARKYADKRAAVARSKFVVLKGSD